MGTNQVLSVCPEETVPPLLGAVLPTNWGPATNCWREGGTVGIAYRCDKAEGITYGVWDGIVTLEQWRHSFQRQVKDRDWPAGRLYLSDLRFGSLHPSIREEELQQMAELYGTHLERLKVVLKHAIVAPTQFRQAMFFERFISRFPITIIVFGDCGPACTWLGVDVKAAMRALEELRKTLRERARTGTGKSASCRSSI